MATQKELIADLIIEINSMKSKLPNGELKLIQKSLDDLEKGQCDIKEDVKGIQRRLFNPDNGIIVEVNKNTERMDERDANLSGWLKEIEHFHGIVAWKKTVQKGLWVLYSAMIGIIIKLLFWD
jgi:hypothetical protein